MTSVDHFLAKKVFRRMPEDDDELWWFVKALWGVTIPRKSVCKGHCSPFEAFADAYFARYPVTVWKASRGFGGKTNTLALLTGTEAVALGAQSTLLGGSGAQSQRVHEEMVNAWSHPNAPKDLLSKDPTRFDTYLTNGGHVRTLMASQTSVRGPHPSRLRLDEIDEMDLDILEAAQGQPMRQKKHDGTYIETQTVMSSTHQYPDKTMSTILQRAKENHWPVYHWCYLETSNPADGWLTPEEIERKRTEVTSHMWNVEYELQEPSIEGRAIDTESVERAFMAELGVFEGDDGELIVIEDPIQHAAQSHKWPYVTAVDWAKEIDWTVVATFRTDEIPWKCVAFQRYARRPWPMMVKRAQAQWERYNGLFLHDATGIGNVIDDFLQGDRRAIKPIVLSGGRARSDMFTEYIAAIESGDIVWPRIMYAYEEHKYATVADLFGTGHPPDTFIVGSLAWSTHKLKRVHRAVTPIGMTKTPGWTV